jgi:hypothetical protein
MFFYHVITFQLRQHFYTEHAVIFTPSSHFSERLHFYTEHEWPSPQHCMRIHSDACIHDQFLITAILHHTYIRNQIHTWIQSHYKQLYICSCWYLIKLVRWVFIIWYVRLTARCFTRFLRFSPQTSTYHIPSPGLPCDIHWWNNGVFEKPVHDFGPKTDIFLLK